MSLQRWVAGVLVCALLNGCTTMRALPVNNPPTIAAAVRPGDTVVCTFRDGTQATLEITAVETDALVAGQRRVPLSDLAQLEVKRIAAGKTAFVSVAVVVVAVGLFLLWVISRVDKDDRNGNDPR